MLDIKFIRQNPEIVKEACRKKQAKIDIDLLLEVDEKKRKLLQTLEEIRAKKNKASLQIRELKNEEEKKKIILEMRELDKDSGEIAKNLDESENKFNDLMSVIPNIPLDSVPVGADERSNVVLKEVGEKPKFDFEPKDYLEIAEKLDLIDIKRAAKVSGSRFGYLKRGAVLLEFALINFAFGVLTSEDIIKKIANSVKKGYSTKIFTPIIPPKMINPDTYKRMARLSEKDKDEKYYLPQDDLYLIGSAEHTLGPMHMDEIIDEDEFPIRYVGFSTCFRREAGAYGKDTKGILRVHQFDKVEIESFVVPENSILEQDFFIAIQEYLMKSLELPYRVVLLCAGEMGGPDARQVDIETWMPGENKYRETHSADLMTDYQSRRLNTRVRRKNGKAELVHMNDATAFAIGRTLIAIIGNYQQKDGSLSVPKVLQKYTGFKKIKR